MIWFLLRKISNICQVIENYILLKLKGHKVFWHNLLAIVIVELFALSIMHIILTWINFVFVVFGRSLHLIHWFECCKHDFAVLAPSFLLSTSILYSCRLLLHLSYYIHWYSHEVRCPWGSLQCSVFLSVWFGGGLCYLWHRLVNLKIIWLNCYEKI